MMLWVNLIMDTMGALALGTEPPRLTLLDRRPYKKSSQLVSRVMWRNIFVQSAYQIALLLILLFNGPSMLGVNPGGTCLVVSPARCEVKDHTHYSIIFNAFVWCQVFNEFNARDIGNDWKVFRGLSGNPMFLGVIALTSVLQVFIIEVGGEFTRTGHLTAEQWLMTFLMGMVALPLGMIGRFLPPQTESDSVFAGVSEIIPDETPAAVISVAGSGSTGATQ
jgi:magnesium-transporting ATPase (P-type)